MFSLILNKYFLMILISNLNQKSPRKDHKSKVLLDEQHNLILRWYFWSVWSRAIPDLFLGPYTEHILALLESNRSNR